MISPFTHLDRNVNKPKLIQHAACCFRTGYFISVFRSAVPLHHAPDPQAGAGDQRDDDNQEDQELHGFYNMGSRKKKKEPRKITVSCRLVRTTSGKLPTG